MRTVGHVEFEPNVAGVESDYVDVSQVEKTGTAYTSGYPLNEDCWEPYKDIFMIDVSEPANPKVIGVLPRPVPPADAVFSDFCQRRGSFGPKRSGYYTQPGTKYATICGFAVPRFDEEPVVSYAMGNLSHGVYVEYDRNL